MVNASNIINRCVEEEGKRLLYSELNRLLPTVLKVKPRLTRAAVEKDCKKRGGGGQGRDCNRK